MWQLSSCSDRDNVSTVNLRRWSLLNVPVFESSVCIVSYPSYVFLLIISGMYNTYCSEIIFFDKKPIQKNDAKSLK